MAVTVPTRFTVYDAGALELFKSQQAIIDDDWLTLAQNASLVYAAGGLGTMFSSNWTTAHTTTASWVSVGIVPFTFSNFRELGTLNHSIVIVGTNSQCRVTYWNTAYTVQLVGPITVTAAAGSGTIAGAATSDILVEVELQETVAGGTVSSVRVNESALTVTELP